MNSPQPLNNRKSQIRKILSTKFYPLDYLEPEQLGYFKLLHWEGSWLREQLAEASRKPQRFWGMLHRDGIYFSLVYVGCTALEAMNAKQIRLSFRSPADESICAPYVLIKITY